ncbi:pentapeptide repeat protein [[Leptolyngbya] sp. PCC 7376]|uniref:pentapeptide repeat-containing protein n=1 Tax=[Leptolyngbya] sp. PCC 7376 TaxID=111781 RepID=UPI00029F3CFE|nr:pentapeptide repeat-containing protein [[Leptolyngbya] sp. PCC 7376]AFY36884.1 pentapeptide repeat protein [[Leptolyngbya] sp. PCC 7376]
MAKPPKPIPEKLTEKTAFEIYQQRLKHGIEENSDADWQQAIEYLQKHRFKVRLWQLKQYVITFAFQTERRLEDLAALLYKMAIFEILDFAGKAAIIIAVYSYFAGAEDRQKQSNYQAWQVINSAVGQVHGGGRTDALEDLNENNVSLLGINLQNAHIPGVNLKEAYLVNANLKDADLSWANLERTLLWDANLEGADLVKANLQEAGLVNANLEKANLMLASLEEAYLMSANLEKTDFISANLEGANFTEANLKGARLTGVNLKRVNFTKANLKGVRLVSINLDEADFTKANLSEIQFLGGISDFQKLTLEQLEQSCFWDNGITVWDEQTKKRISLGVAVIEKAMNESPYNVAACTEYWDERKTRETELKQ